MVYILGNHPMYRHIMPPRSHDYTRQAIINTAAHIPCVAILRNRGLIKVLGILVETRASRKLEIRRAVLGPMVWIVEKLTLGRLIAVVSSALRAALV